MVRQVFTDDYSTNPVGSRVTVNNGAWSHDAANNALVQTTTANATHLAHHSDVPQSIPTWAMEQADITLVTDPSNRKHLGLFLQAYGAPARSGYRIGNLDAAWQVTRFINNAEAGIGVTSSLVGGWTVGQTKTLRVEFEMGNFRFYVGGVLAMTWAEATYNSFQPGFWNYGSSIRVDNLVWESGVDVRDPADDRELLADGKTLAPVAGAPHARRVTVWNGTPTPTKKGQLWLDTTGA